MDQLSDDEKSRLFVLPVVDCSGASKLFLGKWKDSLVTESKRQAIRSTVTGTAKCATISLL